MLQFVAVNFIGNVIVNLEPGKRKINLEAGNSNSVTLNFCYAHFKKHKINCIFHFTFMKQLKPVRDDNDRKRKIGKKEKEDTNRIML